MFESSLRNGNDNSFLRHDQPLFAKVCLDVNDTETAYETAIAYIHETEVGVLTIRSSYFTQFKFIHPSHRNTFHHPKCDVQHLSLQRAGSDFLEYFRMLHVNFITMSGVSHKNKSKSFLACINVDVRSQLLSEPRYFSPRALEIVCLSVQNSCCLRSEHIEHDV